MEITLKYEKNKVLPLQPGDTHGNFPSVICRLRVFSEKDEIFDARKILLKKI